MHQPQPALLDRLRAILPDITERAEALDLAPGQLPEADVAVLAAAGLLIAPFPITQGGTGWDGAAALEALRLVGRANLSLGRLYEGHVNAVRLVVRHGTSEQIVAAVDAARHGKLFGVWNTESPEVRLRLENGALAGGKVLCSGAGLVERALVTARRGHDGRLQMLLVPMQRHTWRADRSEWTPTGMRASATGGVNFDGVAVTPALLLGEPDAYLAQPEFSTGAWRFLAVQLGGIEAVAEALRAHLLRTQRGADPHQAARLGSALVAAETARIWVHAAAAMTERPAADPERTIAYVNLARGVVERAGLDVMEIAHRSVGLQAFMWPNPLERLVRDLGTYLRQPAPDRALLMGAAIGLACTDPVGEMWG